MHKIAPLEEARPSDYTATFNRRGESYDRAMTLYPRARVQEFETLLACAALREGDIVADIPSGGGYLADFIGPAVDLTFLETSRVFFELAGRRKKGRAVLTTDNVIPGPGDYFDKILSLAGLHHNPDPLAFFKACARALKPGGVLCVADVAEDSAPARFLNIFVDRHCPEGHQGRFFTAAALEMIGKSGLEIDYEKKRAYDWVFPDRTGMAAYCGLLFGINHLSAAEIEAGIAEFVGFREENGLILMRWELVFIRAIKP